MEKVCFLVILKYITTELNKKFPEKYANDIKSVKDEFPEFVHFVKHHSINALYHQMTAFL